jgi:hypothetical protein
MPSADQVPYDRNIRPEYSRFGRPVRRTRSSKLKQCPKVKIETTQLRKQASYVWLPTRGGSFDPSRLGHALRTPGLKRASIGFGGPGLHCTARPAIFEFQARHGFQKPSGTILVELGCCAVGRRDLSHVSRIGCVVFFGDFRAGLYPNDRQV